MASPTAPHQDMINAAAGSSPVSATSPTSPDMGLEYHSPEFHPAHSHADIEQEAHELKPHLHRRRTNNYEQALRDSAAASGQGDHHDAASLAYRSDEHGPNAPPAVLTERKQSFKMSDQKRAAMEHTLNADPKSPGYTTTSPTTGK